ncbi:hypothetical protein MUO66_01825 [Candidatus Bathyarchaeota archaeon]|nr:hypothetical protein [Candidatus Bathyarchaeota archaeon]
MKKINLVIVITFFILAIYFAIFNWDVFILQLNVSLWFTTITLPLIAFIFLLSLIFLIFQWVAAIISDMSIEKILTKKDEEINTAKATFYDSNENRVQ